MKHNFGLDPTIAYIKLPTADACGTFLMILAYMSSSSCVKLLSLNCGPTGVTTALLFAMLKVSRTFYKYFLCDSFRVHFFMSLIISIPSILEAARRFFISNSFFKLSLILLISLESFDAINMSSRGRMRFCRMR